MPTAPPDCETLSSPRYWRALAPDFHIADPEFLKPNAGDVVRESDVTAAADGLACEGYVQLRGIDLAADFDAMAGVARKLSAEGLAAVFAFVYDEFWRPYFRLDPLYRALLGPYTFLPDFWAWNVDHASGEAGWEPHRDRGREALLADGAPKSLTTWVAVSEATPLNGCVYIVPADRDPTYDTDAESQRRYDHANIRALPALPGDVLIWNQAVMHWGARSSPRARESRVSLSMEVRRRDVAGVESPLIAPWEIVPFGQRLKLIAQKILHYRHMSRIDPALEALARSIGG